jgi:CheY-like chemotaxis protein
VTLKSHHTKTVLVVDDEPAIRMMIYRILTGQGYHVLEAGDGLAAHSWHDEIGQQQVHSVGGAGSRIQ